MLPWLVITADRCSGGRGVRGHALTWFLRAYFGRRRVAQCTPAEYRADPLAAATTFIGLPSSLDGRELEQLAGRSGRVAAFDYRDRHELAWNDEQEPILRAAAAAYLKPWREPAWNYGIRMGLLPLRRFAGLTAAIAHDRALRRLGVRPRPKYDVAFLGMPNRTRLFRQGKVVKVDQRVNWLREIKCDAPELRFWGGLIKFNDRYLRRIALIYGDVDELYFPHRKMHRKVPFPAYWRAIRHSRVVLAPGGNVPWTYRHYEGLYAGAALVSIDFRQRDLLVPLPASGIVHVPDDAPVVPAVHDALALAAQQPALARASFAHLDRYLRLGAYSRSRPATLERFMAHLE